jgi:hypothetical protein
MNGHLYRLRGYCGVALFCLAFIFGTFRAVAFIDNAALLSNSIPDGASVMPRTMFTQTWTFLNAGSSTWTPGQNGYTLNIVGQDTLGALPNFTNTHSSRYIVSAIIDSGQSIVPGGHASFTLTFIAPEAPGLYADIFQLNGTTNFGPQVPVEVRVLIAGSTNQYDRARVISYANNYAGYVCNDGYFWTNGSDYAHFGAGAPVPTAFLGDDCAHFVSSCIGSQSALRGGGLPIPSRVPPTYGEPGAARLVQTVLIGGGYAKEVNSLDEMSPGDVVGWNWEGDTNMADLDHVTLYMGNGLVTSHAISALDVSANTFFQSSEPNFVRHLIHIFDSPTITLTNVADKVVLSWGTNWTGYGLYSSTSLQPDAAWTKVTNNPVRVGKSLMVTNTIASDSLFYRLVLP